MFTDADSLVYEIETNGVYEDFFEDKDLFDFSDYSKDWNIFDPVKKKYCQNERWIQRKNN